MIKTFRHKGLETFFRTGSKAGIQPAHAKRLKAQLAKLDTSKGPEDMAMPGWKLHPLMHDLAGHWAVWVSGNWRMTFTFENGDAVLVDYRDYH
ncbi:MAG TPA: type II toxin-antitoxin system RelE/ParE family toxin [Candidatus Desulfobacillus denitrificans]|jgi:proteic killer suppression protein|nr:type II toxin-antitoxin system RelE/ParE family toxin [Candidatus Desulfobacillus denitrificans]